MNESKHLATEPNKPSLTHARFTLDGARGLRDPRITPIRGDLADIALAGQIFTPHYAVPLPHICMVERAGLYPDMDDSGRMGSELNTGEGFAVLDRIGEWAWGYCQHDGYVGFIRADALAIGEAEPAALTQDDAAAVAETYLGTPYVWGGRSRSGIDCSGLMQLAFAATGFALPRDSDQQAAALAGAGSAVADGSPVARGDLFFFDGHVALAIDATSAIHASGEAGKVVIEAQDALIAAMEAAGKAFTGIWRPAA